MLSQPLQDHDYRTVKTLLTKIDTGLQQIKCRSISSLHTKLISQIVSREQLCQFEQLPGILMNWINNHQNKSEYLVKCLSMLHELSKEQKGKILLKQYETLEFLECFRKHLTTRQSALEVILDKLQTYLEHIDGTIRNMLPLGRQTKQEDKQENDSTMSNKEEETPGKAKVMKEQTKETPQIQSKFSESLQFVIALSQLEQSSEKYIFDLTVQLKYGNKRIQFDTLRMIQQFVRQHPSDNFRNKSDLIQQLAKYVEEAIYPNEAAETLHMILKGIIKQQNRTDSPELRKDPPEKTIKFLFPLKQSILNSAYSQPILETIRENFKLEWFDWLTNIRAAWTADYIVQILRKLPTEFLEKRQEAIKALTPTILSSNTFELHQSLTSLLDSEQYQSKLRSNISRTAYLKIKNRKFNPSTIPSMMQPLHQGILGLHYEPSLISLYIDTWVYLYICAFREEPLKEYYEPMTRMILKISESAVSQHLYEQLLSRSYLQVSMQYLSEEYTVSELILSMMSEQRVFMHLFNRCLADNKSTLYMLEITKLLYIHHSQHMQQQIVRLISILTVLSQHPDSKISKLATSIASKIDSNPIIHIFSKDNLMDIPREQPLKPIVVDDESLTNIINIVCDDRLDQSVRLTGLSQLIHLLDRTQQVSLALQNRLHSLNEYLLKNTLDTQMTLHLNFILGLKFGCRLYGSSKLMKMMDEPMSVSMKHRVLSLLYLHAFRNPFCQDMISHWMLQSNKYHHYFNLKVEHKPSVEHQEVQQEQRQPEQPTIKDPHDVDQLIRFIYMHPDSTITIKYDEICPIIGKALASTAPDSHLSLIKTLFKLYQERPQQFKQLSQDFRLHCLPTTNNIMRKQNKWLLVDCLTIIQCLGCTHYKIQDYNLEHYEVRMLLLEMLEEYATVHDTIVKECNMRVIRRLIQLPTVTTRLLSNDYSRLCILNYVSKLTSPQCLCFLIRYISQTVTEHHYTIFNQLIEIVMGKESVVMKAGALKALRQWILLDQSQLIKIHNLNIIPMLIGLLLQSQPSMLLQAIIGLINVMDKRYDTTDILVSIMGRQVSQQVVYECCIGIMSNGNPQTLLTSTPLLSHLINRLRNTTNCKTLSAIGQLLFKISHHQDLFVFHLNKILSESSSNTSEALLDIFSAHLPSTDIHYHRMFCRLIAIWYKCHPILQRKPELYQQLRKYGMANCLIAISNQAKRQCVESGDYEQYMQQALNTIDSIFVEDIRKNVAASRISRTDSPELQNILIFLKSYFHPPCTNISLPSITMVVIEKIYQLTTKRTKEFTDFKKVISNFSANENLAMMLTKNTFLTEVINLCLRADTPPTIFKQSLDILTILSSQAEIRAVVFRNRLIAQLTGRVYRIHESKNQDASKLKFCQEVLRYLLHLSSFKDAHTKIITDKHFFDLLVQLAFNDSTVSLMLLANLSYSKHNKTMFISHKEVHKCIMTVLSGERHSQQQKKYTLSLLYNMLYKSAAAIKIYKKKEVMQEFRMLLVSSKKEQQETLKRVIQILESDYS